MPDIQVNTDLSIIPLPAYKLYIARISQSGTSAPGAVVLQNTIGEMTWSRTGIGVYTCVSAGLFTIDKTICLPFGDASNGSVFGILSANTIGYYQVNAGSDINQIALSTYSDLAYTYVEWSTIGGNLTVEIRVYL